MFATFTVELPAIENAFGVETLMTLVAVTGPSWKLLIDIAFSVRLPKVKVDPARASKVPLLFTVTAPEIVPGFAKPVAGRPLRVPPLFTVTDPVPVALPVVLFTC